MITRFFAPEEIINYFEQGKLKSDLLNKETIVLCSIADLLDICEAYKKGNLTLSHIELQEKFNTFNEELVETGIIFVVDLDQNNLSAALFERNDSNIVIDFWDKAANQHISPKRSIRYLTLRSINDSTWWSENVYQEMEGYHTVRDE